VLAYYFVFLLIVRSVAPFGAQSMNAAMDVATRDRMYAAWNFFDVNAGVSS
jgi:hypothetical protein